MQIEGQTLFGAWLSACLTKASVEVADHPSSGSGVLVQSKRSNPILRLVQDAPGICGAQNVASDESVDKSQSNSAAGNGD